MKLFEKLKEKINHLLRRPQQPQFDIVTNNAIAANNTAQAGTATANHPNPLASNPVLVTRRVSSSARTQVGARYEIHDAGILNEIIGRDQTSPTSTTNQVFTTPQSQLTFATPASVYHDAAAIAPQTPTPAPRTSSPTFSPTTSLVANDSPNSSTFHQSQTTATQETESVESSTAPVSASNSASTAAAIVALPAQLPAPSTRPAPRIPSCENPRRRGTIHGQISLAELQALFGPSSAGELPPLPEESPVAAAVGGQSTAYEQSPSSTEHSATESEEPSVTADTASEPSTFEHSASSVGDTSDQSKESSQLAKAWYVRIPSYISPADSDGSVFLDFKPFNISPHLDKTVSMSLPTVMSDVQPPVAPSSRPTSKISLSTINDLDSFSPKHFRFSQQRFTIDVSKTNTVTANGDVELGALVEESSPNSASDLVKAAVTARTEYTMKLYAEDKKLPPTPPSPVGYSVLRYKLLTIYHVLFFLCFAGNMIAFFVHVCRHKKLSDVRNLSVSATAVAANFTALIAIRQDWLINFTYWVARQIPLSAPLKIRNWAAGVYENGGVHTGCASSATWWFFYYGVSYAYQFIHGFSDSIAILVITLCIMVLLLCIMLTAFPSMRAKHHNLFEYTHRYGGWAVLAAFWAHFFLFTHECSTESDDTFGYLVLTAPAFWFLLVSLFFTVLPWFFLRKVRAYPVRLSQHAIQLCFYEPIHLFKGVGLSRTRFGELHSFAAIPNRDGTGFSTLVSSAGDWTKATINNPQEHYWLRGIPRTGVLCIAPLFSKILVVATGSGIGPCLGVIQDLPCCQVRLLWFTRRPFATFGADICEKVLAVDPEAMITDSTRPAPDGSKVKLDAFLVAYNAYVKVNPEAVLVISNKETTTDLIYAFRRRNISCFGPIWDS